MASRLLPTTIPTPVRRGQNPRARRFMRVLRVGIQVRGLANPCPDSRPGTDPGSGNPQLDMEGSMPFPAR